MSFLSSLGKTTGGIIFYLSLSVLILSMIMTQFLQYEEIQPAISGLLEKQILANMTEDQLNILYGGLIEECKRSASGLISVPLFESRNITFSCSELNQTKPSDVPKKITKNLFDGIYYKKYNCNFIQCIIQENGINKYLLFLSLKAYNFFDSLKIYSIIGIAVSVALIAVSIRTWYGAAKAIGSSCLISGIPFFILFFFKEPIIEKLVAVKRQEAVQVVTKIFESASYIFLVVLIVGILLTALGFVGGYLAKKKTKKEGGK
jgi:hypothetical protein